MTDMIKFQHGIKNEEQARQIAQEFTIAIGKFASLPQDTSDERYNNLNSA